ncbi:hypothetical protein P3X46_006364 [Hevea brasiliensis]|uniref:Transmembrane protein n=1 Tax=Hevea brasiliensis TaxID=3981 RepID=A0ABQ9MT92_HEVBR|nr:uncharacterized protein LOC110657522 [Hevea brasiliensis]KAJ9182361.1 hypothetical protein P3X46_006364 [Hevea brasiliensis]
MESGGAGGGGGGGGLLLLTKPGFIQFHQKPLFPFKTSNFYSYYIFRKSNIAIITPATTSASYRRWDSNAESVGSKKFKFKFRDKNKKYRENGDMEERNEEVEDYRRKGKKRRWWLDKPTGMVEEEEEEDAGILEEFVDSLWIFKLFKSYGWALPPIILSWLIATGPKAFLMALALPLGQSALTFVFGKLWGSTQSKPNSKARKKRKPFGSSSSNVEMDDEELEERQKTKKGNKEFQSWVVNGSVNRDSQGTPNLGGWDELDEMESMQQPSQRACQTQKKSSANGKLGRRRRKSNAPLLLRLLVAVFPFLGSWIKML